MEKDLEQKMRLRVKALGGLALKFTSPGFSGVPDRICLLPGGRVVFVEMKAPGQKPTALQLRVHELIRGLGFDVRVIDSVADICKLN